VGAAEAGREQAEEGLARLKEKKKRDLKEVRRLNERMMELQQARREEVSDLEGSLQELRAKTSELEHALAQALSEKDQLQQEATAAAAAAAATGGGDKSQSSSSSPIPPEGTVPVPTGDPKPRPQEPQQEEQHQGGRAREEMVRVGEGLRPE
ncbi:unnamed protein product, partial [Ectocarpus sp. 8 AP-2014]